MFIAKITGLTGFGFSVTKCCGLTHICIYIKGQEHQLTKDHAIEHVCCTDNWSWLFNHKMLWSDAHFYLHLSKADNKGQEHLGMMVHHHVPRVSCKKVGFLSLRTRSGTLALYIMMGIAWSYLMNNVNKNSLSPDAAKYPLLCDQLHCRWMGLFRQQTLFVGHQMLVIK